MNHLLENLLTASFHGSIVILAVMIARLILRKTPKKYICLLWLLAGIRLLLPVQVRSDLSLQPVIVLPNWLHGAQWTVILPWLWGSVALCFGIYSIVSYRKLKNQVREAVRIRGGWESDRIETAFILGFIKPRIYIPMGMSKQARKHILDHERAHLDKGDHWIKMIGFLALALHWFNPLVWAAYILLCRDIEMACDERIVQFMEPEERKSYSAALLQCSAARMHFASPVAFGEISVKQRILAVLNYKKHGFWMGLCGVLAIAFVTLCLMTSPSGEKEPPLTPQQQAQQDSMEQSRLDLESVFEKEEFQYEISASEDSGRFLWNVKLRKLGQDTIWLYTPSGRVDVTEGRMERGGVHYAWQNGKWIRTDTADTRFEEWLNLIRWDPETVEFVSEEEFEDRIERNFTALWEGEDKTVHTATMVCGYSKDGVLQGMYVYQPDDAHADRLHLVLTPIDVLLGYGMTVEELFAQADAAVGEGTVSSEELEEQAELDSWGIHFRVDDDRLTGYGSDVAYSQDEFGFGEIHTTEAYWIERKVDGYWEKVPTVTEPSWREGNLGVGVRATFGYLDWSVLYGKLEAGLYRLGKNFTCYDWGSGYNRTQAIYSEFTIHEEVNSDSPEAAAAVERCYAAWEEVAAREHVHFKTSWSGLEETWINGGNYLKISQFGQDEQIPENNGRVDINAVWNGVGYTQVREDPNRRGSQVIGMQLSTLDAQGAVWEHSFADDPCTTFNARTNKTASFPEGIGVISDEMVRFVLSWRNGGDQEDNTCLLTYFFDEEGKLIRMEWKALWFAFSGEQHMEEPYWAEVYDTSPEEIDAVIKSYTKDLIVESFSWADAKAKYTDEAFNIRETDFVNNGGNSISGCIDAAKLALKEYPNLGEYLTVTVFRDTDAGMWKVTIKSYVDYQATMGYRDIYLTDDGQTKLLVYEGPLGYDEPRK